MPNSGSVALFVGVLTIFGGLFGYVGALDLSHPEDGEIDVRSASCDERVSAPNTTVVASLDDPSSEFPDAEAIVRYRVTVSAPPGANVAVATNERIVDTSAGIDDTSQKWMRVTNETATFEVVVPARDSGDGWAFARPPTARYKWTSGDDVSCGRAMAANASTEFVAGGDLEVTHSQQGVLVSPGPHEERTVTEDGMQIRVIHDRSISDARFNLDNASKDMADVARQFDANSSTSRVTMFAVPVERLRTGKAYPGMFNESTRTVMVPARGDGSRPVWIHEYVHGVQSFDTAENMDWAVEGSAHYYEQLIPLQRAPIACEYNREFVTQNTIFSSTRQTTDTVLTEPDTWGINDQYYRGASVFLVLDHKLRHSENGTHTSMDMIRWMNAHEGEVTYSEFRRAVVERSNSSTGQWLDAHVAGNESLEDESESVLVPRSGPVPEPDCPNVDTGQ